MRRLFVLLCAGLMAWTAGLLLSAIVLLAVGLSDAVANAWSEMFGFAAFVGSYVLLRRRAPGALLVPVAVRPCAATATLAVAGAVLTYLSLVFAVGAVHGRAHLHPAFHWTGAVVPLYILAAAAMEEVLCRGYLLGMARARLGTMWAVLASSLAFSLLHWPAVEDKALELPALFVDGVALSLLALRAGSLLPAIAVHAVFNYGSGLSRLDLGPPLDHSGVFAYEGGPPNAAFLVCKMTLALAAVIVLVRRLMLGTDKSDKGGAPKVGARTSA